MPHLFNQRKKELTQLTGRLQRAVYTVVAPLQVKAYCTNEPVPFAQRTTGRRKVLKPGTPWGQLFDCAWMEFTGQVPATAAGKDIVLLIDVGGEACVFDAHGVPRQGLTNLNSEFDKSLGMPGKHVVPFAPRARGGEAVSVWVDAATNDLFGRMPDDGCLKEAAIAIRHPELYALHYDWEVLEELLRQLPETAAQHQQLLHALCEAANLLHDVPAVSAATARQARKLLAPHLALRGGDPSLRITAIGHSHMDLAWLWPLRETRRKCARTFSTVLRNMERFPEYVYGASQPQQLAWIKADHPALYSQLQARAREGRFDCQGGMWVESDTNVPSGEALVRQFMHGIRYWQEEFGVRVRDLWLPDVFGYSGAMPQIMALCGLRYFMTQKMSWNRINPFPHQSFWWQGIDGTRVLAHMLPEETYNSPASPRAIAKCERNYKDAAVSGHALMLFGIGDGGGGPGEEHLERLAREKNLAGLSPVRQARASEFFAAWEKDSAQFATWQGELYLEMHQGTYTTQARNKQYNRRLEHALRNCEWLNTLANQFAPASAPARANTRANASAKQANPQAALDRIWKEVLLYQFHDILPGSSIQRVYTESLARYATLLAETEALTSAATDRLAWRIDTSTAAQPRVVFNTLAWDRQVWIASGNRYLSATIPAGGYAVVDLHAAAKTPRPGLLATARALENDLLCLQFNADGSLASVFDKQHQRELLAAPGNRLTLWPDGSNAWDFPPHYRELPPTFGTLTQARARVEGPYAWIEQDYQIGVSRIRQTIRLSLGSRRVDFITRVDWHERHKMLRTSFPTTVQASEATFEIQFGAIRRPTHRNTSWDAARIEVPAQKWADLSDHGYGVALLNDCKYGYSAQDGTLELNLLRATDEPGADADRGAHTFTYSLFPHPGDHIAGGVVRAAHELNTPCIEWTPPKTAPRARAKAAAAANPASATTWFHLDSADLILDTIKSAEDTDGTILRLYECHGSSGRATLQVALPVQQVERCNLLEEPLTAASAASSAPAPRLHKNTGATTTIEITYAPFQIITLRLR